LPPCGEEEYKDAYQKEADVKSWLLKPPSFEDLLRLLQAWRVWLGGAVLGAFFATILFFVAPPPYRARATVLIDFNVEQAIPQATSDLQINVYLQHETDMLIEVAWADSTLSPVASQTGTSIKDLRDKRLHLTQSTEGGWRFYADAPDQKSAVNIASAWAASFYNAIQAKVPGASPFLTAGLSQAEDLPVRRAISLGVYIFCGAAISVILLAILILFFDRKEPGK
jgi:capsular polysaccharide biosynthesis protein